MKIVRFDKKAIGACAEGRSTSRQFVACRQHGNVQELKVRFAAQPMKKCYAAHKRHVDIDNNCIRQLVRCFASLESGEGFKAIRLVSDL